MKTTGVETIQLVNSDCIAAMENLEDGFVDLILTDPPYNLGAFMRGRDTNLKAMRSNYFGAAGWDDLDTNQWEIFMDKFFAESARIIKPGGSLLVFMAIIKVETVIRLAERYGFYYKTTGIWHKRNPMPRNMNLHFVNSTEAWVYFTYQSKTGVFNNDGKVIHDFIETSVTPRSEKVFGKHPTQKPVKLMSFFIEHLTNAGDMVLDPFMGSGTTGVAARFHGRAFVGIELSSEYFTMAQDRIQGILA